PISAEVRLAIVKRTAHEKPKHATHWSARMLAEEIGVGHTTVQRVWKEHGLKPHLTRPFKLSNDPHCRALPQSTRQGSRALRRREKPDSSARPYATGPADEEGPCSNDDARLQAQWHDHIVRGTRCEDRRGHRRVSATPPRQGIHPFPEKDQPGRSQAPRRACDLRQLQDPQDQGDAGLARQTRASSCTSHQHRRPGSTWSSGCSPKSPASKSAAAYSRASPNSRLPSRPGSPSATPNRSPSSGPPKPISSSRRMHVPGARWKKTSQRVLNE